MSKGKLLRNLSHWANSAEQDARDMQEEYDAEGVTPIADAVDREKVRLRGTLRTVTSGGGACGGADDCMVFCAGGGVWPPLSWAKVAPAKIRAPLASAGNNALRAFMFVTPCENVRGSARQRGWQ